MEALLQLLHEVHKLTPKLRTHLSGKIKKFTFKKGQIIFKVGQVADKILFIEKGLIRSYTVMEGKRITNYFMKEGNIVISVTSFLEQSPAFETIEALEDCVCWGITYDELQETYKKFPRFDKNGRIITSAYYIMSEKRHYQRHYRNADAIYAEMMEKNDPLLRRVKDYQMASYCGVSKSTFSKVKSDYQDKLQLARSKKVRF